MVVATMVVVLEASVAAGVVVVALDAGEVIDVKRCLLPLVALWSFGVKCEVHAGRLDDRVPSY